MNLKLVETIAFRDVAARLAMHVRSSLRPERLFGRLALEGFSWHTEEFNDGEWSSWFWRKTAVNARVMAPQSLGEVPDG